MPELPEVETTVRGLKPHLVGNTITDLTVRERRLRWPIPETLSSMVVGNKIEKIDRRAKYILIKIGSGHLLMHLGMSGSIRICPSVEPHRVHDHVDLLLNNDLIARFRDPRRFGSVLWLSGDPYDSRLLRHLGPEPDSEDFSGEYLYRLSKSRSTAVKNFIMDGRVVVGVGNIYASESLFRAGIHPLRRANRISAMRYEQIVLSIQETISAAIAFGGTTLRDFVNGSGSPGYFRHELLVYERHKKACKNCGDLIRLKVIRQRSTYYCKFCQT